MTQQTTKNTKPETPEPQTPDETLAALDRAEQTDDGLQVVLDQFTRDTAAAAQAIKERDNKVPGE